MIGSSRSPDPTLEPHTGWRDPPRWRLAVGLPPLLFVLETGIEYAIRARLSELLWMCNVCNIALGLGILLGRPTWVWISTLWLLIGTPLWIWDALVVSGFEIHSFFTHFFSAFLGLYALTRLPLPRRRVWWAALLFLVVVQGASRLLTDAVFNVNMSHGVHPALASVFSSYSAYWLFNLVSFSLVVPAVEWALRRLLIPLTAVATVSSRDIEPGGPPV